MGASSHDIEQDNLLEQAQRLLADGAHLECLAALKANWLSHPQDGKTIELFSKLMKEAGRPELAVKLENLAKCLSIGTSELSHQKLGIQELFEAGFGLIDIRQHELAVMLLKHCLALAPHESIFNYELGFALMSLQRFDEAIPYFEALADKSADFDILLNLAACYTMTRRTNEAASVLVRLGQLNLDQEQLRELNHRKVVLKRLQTLPQKTILSTRDWLYVLYGSVLLRQNNKDEIINEDQTSISTMLAVLKGVLAGMGVDLEVIEYYGLQSRPLARALAELLEIPASSYKGPDRTEKALLAMTWASDIIGPHESFLPNADLRTIFAYGLTWNEPLPLVPEIIGCLGYEEPMPWRQATSNFPAINNDSNVLEEAEFDRAIDTIYKSILYHARDLEADPTIIHSVQEIVDYYSDKTSLLLIGNAATFPYRSEYTAELL